MKIYEIEKPIAIETGSGTYKVDEELSSLTIKDENYLEINVNDCTISINEQTIHDIKTDAHYSEVLDFFASSLNVTQLKLYPAEKKRQENDDMSEEDVAEENMEFELQSSFSKPKEASISFWLTEFNKKFKKSGALKSLIVEIESWSKEYVEMLTTALQLFPMLEELSLIYNGNTNSDNDLAVAIRQELFPKLQQAITEHACLKVLSVPAIFKEDDEDGLLFEDVALIKALLSHPGLVELNLQYSYLSWQTIEKELSESKLQALNFKYTNLDEDNIIYLASALRENNYLLELCIGRNYLGNKGWVMLKEQLLSRSSSLRVLNLGDVAAEPNDPLSQEGINAILALIAGLPLESVILNSIQQASIGEFSAKEYFIKGFINLFRTNCTLKTVKLGWYFNNEDADVLLSAIKENRHSGLMELKLFEGRRIEAETEDPAKFWNELQQAALKINAQATVSKLSPASSYVTYNKELIENIRRKTINRLTYPFKVFSSVLNEQAGDKNKPYVFLSNEIVYHIGRANLANMYSRFSFMSKADKEKQLDAVITEIIGEAEVRKARLANK